MCCIKFIGRCLWFVFTAGVGAGAGAMASMQILGNIKAKNLKKETIETES